jgi:hypothetical protein
MHEFAITGLTISSILGQVRSCFINLIGIFIPNVSQD